MRSLSRRSFTGLLLAGVMLPKALAAPAKKLIEVWKGPSCGCCNDWIKHVEANGFSVKSYDTGNHDMRAKLGLPIRYGSCHTALIDGYVIEGHVPARDIERLLRERPNGIGLAVPAMPVGSPGMDGPEYRGRKENGSWPKLPAPKRPSLIVSPLQYYRWRIHWRDWRSVRTALSVLAFVTVSARSKSLRYLRALDLLSATISTLESGFRTNSLE